MRDMRDPRPELEADERREPARQDAPRAEILAAADPDADIAPAYAAWKVDRQENRQ